MLHHVAAGNPLELCDVCRLVSCSHGTVTARGQTRFELKQGNCVCVCVCVCVCHGVCV
jgi:hypothetical protein